MSEGPRDRLRAVWTRLRRLERREVRSFRAWLEHTRNLVHLSVLLFVPLLMAAVTFLSGRIQELSFLLFPPLASGAYTMFYDPDGRFASPRRFVGGLTLGAVAGLVAVNIEAAVHGIPVGSVQVTPGGAALSVLLTGGVTWALDLEEPAAFSTALLVLVTGTDKLTYVASVATSSILVAAVFTLWRDRFYQQRARYLYTSTHGDDRVLVPVRGPHSDVTARLGARIAAAHDSAKVVLLGLVDPDSVEGTPAEVAGAPTADGGSRTPPDPPDATTGDGTAADPAARGTDGGADGPTDAGDPDGDDRVAETERTDPALDVTATSAMDLEERAADLETVYGVPTEVLVAEASPERPGRSIVQAAHDTNCDLIVTPYETDGDRLAAHIHELFHSDTDTLVHRCADPGDPGEGDWRDVLVPVRRAGDVAHKMIDFATRLAGDRGRVSVCHCIGAQRERAEAERMLGDLAETVEGRVETRIARADIQEFLARASSGYDLVIIGSSSDRSAASRFVSRPTFERIDDLDCDFAILDRNFKY
jgi:hypothetical protein